MRSNVLIKTIKTIVLLCGLSLSLTLVAAETVNINRADAATMIENWKGIGEVKAKAIVAYRKKNGPFKSIDDLANVKGIGDGILKKNRKLMSTSRGAVKAVGKASQSTKKAAVKKTDAKKSADKKSSTSSSKKSTSSAKKKDKPAKKESSAKKSTSKKSNSKKKTSKKKTPNT